MRYLLFCHTNIKERDEIDEKIINHPLSLSSHFHLIIIISTNLSSSYFLSINISKERKPWDNRLEDEMDKILVETSSKDDSI